ncbi:alkaline phosphatase family protein [Clostridiaceae bacterium HSG29]|nr:alkaline phosphatase family protein [Clostridiaceae bacterium HSG29]
MNNRNIFLIMLVLFSLLLCSCSEAKVEYGNILISGDIKENIDFNKLITSLETEDIEVNGEKVSAYDFENIVNLFDSVYHQNNIYLVALDGFSNKFSSNSISDTYLFYNEVNGWCYYSEKHPVNSKIKNIKKIIVANDTDEINYEFGFNIIKNDETIHYDISELLLNKSSIYFHLDGVTKKDNNELGVMKKKEIIAFNDLDLDDIKFLLMSSEGNHEYLKSDKGYLVIDGSKVNYIDKKNSKVINDVKGVMENYPAISIMDVYSDSLYYIEKDIPVMILFIDGISYFQYKTILKKYPDLVISNIDNVKKATSVFKPVTNAGYAAMITGKTPIENGILNRDYRKLLVPSIFDSTANALLIEGNIKILDLSVETILNLDKNENGYTDDEIFESAIKEMDKRDNISLFLVHFHGFDDNGHKYGATDSKTIDYIKTIDKYVEELSSGWNGKIIMTADHGMHDLLDKGTHGEFRAEDLFVPYVIFDGGLYE